MDLDVLRLRCMGDGVVQLILRCEEGYVYTKDTDFYPNKFPVVFSDLLSPDELISILNNPKNYRYGSFYYSFIPFILKLENLLKDIIEGKGIPYSFEQDFKNGNPDYSFFSVNDDPWGHPIDQSTLETIEKLKERYLSSLSSNK